MNFIKPLDLAIIAAVVLVLFGPSRLPKIAESLGGAIRSFREHVDKTEADEVERRKESSPEEKPE